MAETFNTNLKNIASTYLDFLNVKVSKRSLEANIEEHPHYPTLFSLSDTFSNYKIPNYALELKADELEDVDVPFVAYVSVPNKGTDFVIVKKYSYESVDVIYKGKKAQRIAATEFKGQYRNIIWTAEPNHESGDPGYVKAKSIERKEIVQKWLSSGLLLAIVCYLFFAFRDVMQTGFYSVILITKILGVAATSLLVQLDMGNDNSLLAKICSIGKKTNCEAVLSSSHAKFMGVSWSDIGWVYFVSTLLILLLPLVDFADALAILAYLGVAAIAYTSYSIYFQAKVIRQWCPLCLSVVTLLLIEGGISISYLMNFSGISFRFEHCMNAFICLGLGYIGLLFWRKFLKNKYEAKNFATAYRRLQYNPAVFNGLLSSQPTAAAGWDDIGISLGPDNAAIQLVKVCNPYCAPCSKAHVILDKMLYENPKVKLKIIFNAFPSPTSKSSQVVKHFLSLHKSLSPADFVIALNDWYSMNPKNYENYAGKYPLSESLDKYDADLKAMFDWCQRSEITYTPTVHVNGYRIPESFDINELHMIKL